MVKRTIPHEKYEEPSRGDVHNCFKEIGFKDPYSYKFVKDVANHFSHQMLGNGSEFESLTNVKDSLKRSNFGSEETFESNLKYHERVQEFISKLSSDKFEGKSPIEKAANAVALFTEAADKVKGKVTEEEPDSDAEGDSQPGEGEGKGETSKPLPIFSKNQDTQSKQSELMDDYAEMSKELNDDPISKYVFDTEGKSKYKALKDLDAENRRILKNLAVIAGKGKIKAKKESPRYKVKPMSRRSQIGNMHSRMEMAGPMFDYKFAKKQLNVRVKPKTGKQMLFLLIDDSGSMCCTLKHEYVNAIIIDRLKAVVAKEATLLIGWFEYNLDVENIVKITNEKEALDFLKNGCFGNFDKSTTDVQRAVETAVQAIKKGHIGDIKITGVKPQIVVMNDGEDFVNPNYTPKIETHAFILGTDNENMSKMVKKSKGTYTRFL